MRFVVYSLAVWRVSRMLVKEPGPGRVFVKIRELSGIEHDAEGEPASWNDYTPLYCVWCTSVYVAVVMLYAPDWLLRLLAASGVTGLIEESNEVVQKAA